MRSKVVKVLECFDAQAVETKMEDGIPDVNYIGGWIELKQAERWPPQGGILRLRHFTQHQRVWLFRRWHKGGRSFLLLRVKREWLLFDGVTASEIVGRADRTTLVERCLRHWLTGLPEKEFRECVQQISPSESDSS